MDCKNKSHEKQRANNGQFPDSIPLVNYPGNESLRSLFFVRGDISPIFFENIC